MDYSQLSDFEINKLVAAQIMPTSLYFENGIAVVVRCDDDEELRKFDPCNYPEDAWPIIKENMISVCAYKRANHGMKAVSWWEADSFGEHITRDDNPLRAAMIVFLMMQEANHA